MPSPTPPPGRARGSGEPSRARAELTFVGARLAQVDLHPTLILNASQPNLLDPDGGGDALLRSIRAGSARLGRLP